MIIGLDFDNTIVCYDTVFHSVAVEKGLIPKTIPRSKEEVRNYLRSIGKEEDWILLQGYVYGARLNEADPFPGFFDFLRACKDLGANVAIVSHKTRHPFAGPPYDLHQAARQWVEFHRAKDSAFEIITDEQVFFELTKQEKIGRIGSLGCTYFVDDLPELLSESTFPADTQRVLFDPAGLHKDDPRWKIVRGWDQLTTLLSRNR